MHLHVGTSGYSYKEWKGVFYPQRFRDAGMLDFYASRFNAVEINNSFYRFPKAEVLEDWRERVPQGFRFALKANQRITHFKQLRGVRDDTLDFLDRASVLGRSLGPVLFQLPPTLKKDAAVLADFLAVLPPDGRYALEFRHDSWFDDDIFQRLQARGCALCVVDDERDKTAAPLSTTGWGYIRLRRDAYSQTQLRQWMQRIGAQDWHDAYVFFKHESQGIAPATATRFLSLMQAG